ncbi:methyltransferase family protein [Azospira restricta]|uniref:Isoprenylcysteine carboxylmethyltransferase family protein n=1 Tax=Azospira restricta TaxID=404405 RepID=A0A974SMX6_9RHOO|nr:isoprenylcysteine carboxylmethyltransferase family protein [Azospira restricta]QRJ62123.1 isoprenylcysteine carboxylmethyltransferase family protein [Azospira restricta]
MNDSPAYGLWSLVAINSAIFILFAASFFKPQSRQDWRTLGLFSAFVVALFTEMYGFPLTIYLLSGWLAERVPGVDFLSHDAGHLLEILFGWKANPHFGPFHLLSNALIIGGFWLLAKAWPVLYEAQQRGALARTGPYARIRHPQYAAFMLVMLGFLLQWPTLVTLAMFPVLVFTYVRLAQREERQALAEHGDAYRAYMNDVPGWWPRFR